MEENRYGSYLSNGAERLGSRNIPDSVRNGPPTSPGLVAVRNLALHALHQHNKFFRLLVSLCLLAHLLEVLRCVANTIGHGGYPRLRRRHSLQDRPGLAKSDPGINALVKLFLQELPIWITDSARQVAPDRAFVL